MENQKPWIGVILITLAIGATIVFAKMNLQIPMYIATLASLGLTILQGANHSSAVTEIKALKKK